MRLAFIAAISALIMPSSADAVILLGTKEGVVTNDTNETVSFSFAGADPSLVHRLRITFDDPEGLFVTGLTWATALMHIRDTVPGGSYTDFFYADEHIPSRAASFVFESGRLDSVPCTPAPRCAFYSNLAMSGEFMIGREFEDTPIRSYRYTIQLTAFAPPVPEPSTWTTMLLGFGAVGGTMRARRTRKIVAA